MNKRIIFSLLFVLIFTFFVFTNITFAVTDVKTIKIESIWYNSTENKMYFRIRNNGNLTINPGEVTANYISKDSGQSVTGIMTLEISLIPEQTNDAFMTYNCYSGTLTVAAPNNQESMDYQCNQSYITISGRLIHTSTGQGISNDLIQYYEMIPGQTWNWKDLTYTDSSGYFSAQIPKPSYKVRMWLSRPYQPDALPGELYIEPFGANQYNITEETRPDNCEQKKLTLSGSTLNVGEIRLWPTVQFYAYTVPEKTDYDWGTTNGYRLVWRILQYDRCCPNSGQDPYGCKGWMGGGGFGYGKWGTAGEKFKIDINKQDSGYHEETITSYYPLISTNEFINNKKFIIKYDQNSKNISTSICGDGICDSIENSTICSADCTASVNKTCTDSDGGKNYYVKGTVAVCTYSSQGGSCGVGADYCVDNILKEGYCEGTSSKLADFTCPYGCSNGACLYSSEKCTNHAQCSKACDDLGIAFHWSGIGSNYKSWNGTCSSNVYGCMTGQCCLGQCNYKTTGDCYCARTNTVDIYGNVCPSGQTCGSDCYCHPTTEGKPDLTIEKIEYYIDNPTNPTKLYFQAYIKNIGTSPCSFSSSIRVPQLSNSQDNKCTYLNAGESCIETGYGYNGLGGTIPPAYYEIEGVVDHQNLVDELNENNNKLKVGTYIPSETIQFKLYPNKYFYYKGEVVEIKAILSSSSNIDFQNSKLEINLKDPNGNVISLPVEKLGTVAAACEISTITNSYTCPAINQYSFYAKYEIPSNATLGLYSVSGKAIVGNIEKNAYSSFQVGEVYSGLVEVSIYPESLTTLIGKRADYKVTITDKHPVPLCTATAQTQVVPATGGVIISEEPVKACGTIIYNYLIEVDGLPYHTVFPTVASVQAGTSKTFELKVFPSSAKTAEGITTAVEKNSITKAVKEERAVSITGTPIAETQSVETTTESSVKEALFKFTIKAYLKDDSNIADSDSAVLIVKFTEGPEPPPFPETEKINVELKKGWNLISLPGKGTGFSYGTCSKTKKPAAFLYLQDRKKYVSLWDAINELGAEEILDYLSTHSFWVYSYEDCNIGFKVESYSTYSNLYIYKGWNLLGTTKDMIGETLNNIKGACSFEKIYTWDAESQKWIEKSENDLIEKMGYGILIKSTSECNLKENLIQPPSFPGD